MAPRDALHEHLHIFPMHICLTMLTKTSALCLYRLPKQFQLLCHLGTDWHSPSEDDLPSPVPPTCNQARARTNPTPLEALASCVPVAGPHCNELAIAPWEAPNWGQRLVYKANTGGTSSDGRQTFIRMITEEDDPATALVHVVGMITNWGRRDGKMMGAAAAVIPRAWGGEEDHDQAFELGIGVSQYDADAFGVSLASHAIRSYLNSGGEACHFIILSRSQAAIAGISNANSRAIQEHALNFAHVVNHILSTCADVSISVEWTPADTCLRGFCQAKFRAQEECKQLSDDNIECRNVLSATFQKQKTQAEAFEQWARKWHNKPPMSLAYRLSLLNPPDDHNQPPMDRSHQR
ncbi:hypothetical protein EI94DRAFT_1797833 [Lactarius quietus]|nr:hypothetical protein EI94DRAFT_1797833 [Lactarius quietus]